MKNFLISILCMGVSFFATTFMLKSYDGNSNEPSSTIKGSISEIKDDKEEVVKEKETIVTESISSSLNFSEITSDYEKWNEYNKENIELSSDFIAVDVGGEEISKKQFLERLKTGNYIPVKLFEADYMYQLHPLNNGVDRKIIKSIKSISSINYSYFLKEGTNFPEFNLTDLNGNNYTSNNTKGQYIVVKLWFAQCTNCIKEFPELNKLYDRYEDKGDVLFFSLVFDSPEKIKKILSKKSFRYPVIANQKDFMQKDIGAIQYPTHIIIDKYGTIQKMVNNVDSLILALDNLTKGDILQEKNF